MTIAIRKTDTKSIRTSRRYVLVLSTLAAIAFAAQPAAAFDKPALVVHNSVAWSGPQAHRDGHAIFQAPHVGSFAATPREVSGGVCDVGDNPMIC